MNVPLHHHRLTRDNRSAQTSVTQQSVPESREEVRRQGRPIESEQVLGCLKILPFSSTVFQELRLEVFCTSKGGTTSIWDRTLPSLVLPNTGRN